MLNKISIQTLNLLHHLRNAKALLRTIPPGFAHFYPKLLPLKKPYHRLCQRARVIRRNQETCHFVLHNLHRSTIT